MCTHGTLLVSGSCTHAGCYATATLVCELSVFYVNMVRCWCVHVYTWYVAGVSCAGWGGVGVGMHPRFWKLHTCWMLRRGNVGVWTFGFLCKHGTLLVCSCVHMVRCWCVMCRLGWGWGGDAFTFLEVAHMLDATPRQRWCVNFRFLCKHGTSNSMHGKSCQMDTL